MNLWLGIDFGTCYSSAAYIDRTGKLNFVRDTDNPGNYAYSIPSSAYVQSDGKILVGNAANLQMRIDPTRYFSEIKRDLGKNIPYYYDGGQLMPEELITHIISKLKKAAEAQADQSFLNLIITVPATYDEHKREIMKMAAQKSGFDRVEIIEEPVAAALSYFQGSDDIANGDILLVYDLGGGTFDAALMQKTGAGYRLLTQPVGDPECGGLDFDRRLFMKLLEQCEPDFRNRLDVENIDELDLKKSRRIFIKRKAMQEYCCKFKHGLSSQDQLSLVAPDAVLDEVDSFSYSRTEFENLIGEMLKGTLDKCDLLIKNAKISIDKLDRIVMTGGSSRIPKVRELLAKHFGKTIQLSADPELSICSGAALYGENRRKMRESPLVSAAGRPGTYSSIADAIEEADIGAVIHVEAGQYEESLVIKKGCRIVGAGTGKTIWKALPGRCCVEVKNCKVSLQKISFRGANESEADCIRFYDGVLQITDCELEPGKGECTGGIDCIGSGNVSVQNSTIKGGDGGIVINDNSTANVSVNNVNIVGCKQFGIFMKGQAVCSMQGGSIENMQSDNEESEPIGVWAQKGKLLLSTVSFLNNSCRVKSCGVNMSPDAEGEIVECLFEAQEIALLAFVVKNELKAKKCSFIKNKLGICGAKEAIVNATECIFTGNDTAVRVTDSGTVTIDGSNFSSNATGIESSGMACLNVTDSLFESDKTGILAMAKSVSINGCSFNKSLDCCVNIAGYSECCIDESRFEHSEIGLYVEENASPVIRQSKIKKCKRGILLANDSRGSINNCSVFDCEVGLIVVDKAAPLFNDCNIATSVTNNVYVGASSNPVFQSCRVHSAAQHEVFIKGGKSRWIDCRIVSRVKEGTAIAVEGNGAPSFEKCHIIAGKDGTAFSIIDAGGKYVQCVVEGEDSYSQKGNLVVVGQNTPKHYPTFRECMISGGYNGVFIAHRGKAALVECTVKGCRNDGIHMEDCEGPQILRCRIIDNHGDGIFGRGNGYASIEGCEVSGHHGYISRNFKVEKPFQLY